MNAAFSPWIQKHKLAFLLLTSGLWGFFMGAFINGCWQVAVEGAQVISGIVQYPPNNPFYIYQIKAWTLLHQLPAIGLKMGMNERQLSLIVSGVMGTLACQALALSVYVFSKNPLVSLAAIFLMISRNSFSYGVIYPIILVGIPGTYGSIGLTFLFVAIAVLAAGKTRTGAVLLGLMPAVHAAMGILGSLAVLTAVCLEWKQNESLRKSFALFYWAGLFLSALSFLIHWPLLQTIPQADSESAREYLTHFIRFWDAHRRPVFATEWGVRINLAMLFLSSIWLGFFRSHLTPPANLMMRIYQMITALSLGFSILSWAPLEWLPTQVLMLMPARLLNVAVFGFAGMWIGLWVHPTSGKKEKAILLLAAFIQETSLLRFCLVSAALISICTFVVRDGKEKMIKHGLTNKLFMRVVFGIALTVMLLPLGIFLREQYRNRFLENWEYSQNSRFYKKISEGKGTLLVGPNLNLQQLITRRPILLDPQALDTVMYAPETAAETARILKEVYRVDFFNGPEASRGNAALPTEDVQSFFKNHTVEDWKKIRRDFGVTQLLTTEGFVLSLPLVDSIPRYELYDIPE